MSDVVLAPYHGGLGDHLQFSTLPEEFYKQQNRKTYIWANAPYRNSEIYDFVWGTNPFVLGKSSNEWNAGDPSGIVYQNIGKTSIMNQEASNGLIPKNYYPKIYYKPLKNIKFNDVYLVDFSSITSEYDYPKLLSHYNMLKCMFTNITFLNVVFKNKLSDNNWKQYKTDDESILVNNIFEYYDMMYSSKGFIGLQSGASCLSCAVKEHNSNLQSICFITKQLYAELTEKNNFIFDNIEYFIYE
jgi:hypothetical protein